MKHTLIAGLLWLSTFPLFAQKSVIPLPLNNDFQFKQNYVFYALPETAFRLNVEVVRSHKKVGIYAEYAEKLLGLTHVIEMDQIVYSLRNIEIQPVEIPDTQYVYAVELSSQQMEEDRFTQMCLQRARVEKCGEACTYRVENLQIPDFFRYYSDLAYMEQKNSYVETQLVDGVVRQVPAVKVQKVEKSNEQQAQEAADKIAQIREDRYALLTGAQEVSYSAEALQKMIDELNELEKNYMALFTGFVVDETEIHTVVVVPEKESAFAFSLSPATGFSTETSPIADENFFITMRSQPDAAGYTDFIERLACSKKYQPRNGYRIRPPKQAQIFVNQGDKTVYSFGEAAVYQLGKIEILSLGHDELEIEKFGFVY